MGIPLSYTAADGEGNLFLSDTANNRVRKVTPDGLIRTVAGTGAPGYSGDGGPATSEEASGPSREATRLQIIWKGHTRNRCTAGRIRDRMLRAAQRAGDAAVHIGRYLHRLPPAGAI